MKPILTILLFLLAGAAVFGQDDADMPVVNCSPAAKVDEFTFTSLNDAKERLDLYGLQIKNSKALGIVIGYGGRNTESSEGRKVASEIEQYLTTKFKFTEYYTVATRDGGHREERSVELYIKYNSCGANPDVSPSLGFDDVNYKEEKQYFDKSVVLKTSADLRSLLVSEIEPPYPAAARAVRASGNVVVLILIDEKGQVIKALAIDGHPLLRLAAENALKQSTFQKLVVNERAIQYGGKFEIDFEKLLEKLSHNDQ